MREALALGVGLLAAGGCLYLQGRPGEQRWLRRLWWALLGTKVVGIVVVYSLGHEGSGSDAALGYIPQAVRVLHGQVPGRDFRTSFNLLPVLLAPVVRVSHSVGAIAAVMVAAEAATVAIYLRSGVDPLRGWRVALLVSSSPIALYWTAATGYNDALIGLAVVAAVVLASRGRDRAAGLALAAGLLFTKLLTLWAAFVFWDRRPRRWVSRLGPSAVVCVLLAFAQRQWGALDEALKSARNATTGGLPHLLHDPSWLGGWTLILAAVLALLLAARFLSGTPSFDERAAVWAGTGLLLLLLSRNANSAYEVAFLLPLVHVVDRPGLDRRRRWWGALAPLVLMASLSPAVQYAHPPHRMSYAASTMVLDGLSILANGALLAMIWRARPARLNPTPGRPTEAQSG